MARFLTLALVAIMFLTVLPTEMGLHRDSTLKKNVNPISVPGSRAALDHDESFSWVNYSALDSDGDSRNDSVRVSFAVVTDGVSERVRVNMTVTNSTGAVRKSDNLEFTARRRAVNITETYFDFRAGRTDSYSFNLTLLDRTHGREEDHSERANISLQFNGRRVRLHASAVVDDLNGNGTRNDVLISCTDDHSLPVLNASVYLDGYLSGYTDRRGRHYRYNLSGDHHEVDVFYSGHHANTDFDIVFPVPEPLTVDPEPMDVDMDGYHDDVRVYARLPDTTPAFGATVSVGWYWGIIGQEGYVQFENLSGGFYMVEVTYRGRITVRSSFFAEAPMNEYEMYFYYIDGRAVEADGDGLSNDLEVYCDVDISGGGTSRIHINATVFDEWALETAFGNTSYETTGTEVESEYFYIHNLSAGTYTIRYELFGPNWTLRDISVQEGAVINDNSSIFNVDRAVNDYDDGGPMDDVLFYSHVKDQGRANTTVRIYYESNDTEYATLMTGEDGSVVLYNVSLGDYYFNAMAGNGDVMDWGNFSIYNLLPRTFQASDYLTDLDWDGMYNDFAIRVYDQFGAGDISTYVIVRDEYGFSVREGWTRDENYGPGFFLARDLWGGDYTYTAVHNGPLLDINISRGKFHSHELPHDYYTPLMIESIVFDGNGTGIPDDVLLRINDTYGQPVDDVRVLLYNALGNRYDRTDANGTVFFYNLPGGKYNLDAEKWNPESPDMKGEASFVSQGAVSVKLDGIYRHIYTKSNLTRNNIGIYVYTRSSANGWENQTIEIGIFNRNNGSLHAVKNDSVLGRSWKRQYIWFTDVPYGNYTAEVRLLNGNGTLVDSTNLTNIVLFEARRVLNTKIIYSPNWGGHTFLRVVPEFAGDNFFKSNFTLENSTGLVNRTEGDFVEYWDIWPDEYRWALTGSFGNMTDSGSVRTTTEHHLRFHLEDIDGDGFFDDISIRVAKNGSGIDDGILELRDSNGIIFDTLQTSNGYIYIYNLSAGNYSYTLTHEQQTLMTGRLHSYTNGYPNHPPAANISHPANGSEHNAAEAIYFDGKNSTDRDTNDTIYYTWHSDIDGILSHQERFNSTSLSPGNHTITMYCDDGHYNNVSASIRLKMIEVNRPPVADSGEDLYGHIGEPVDFLGGGTDADGSLVKYQWDFDGDGTYDWESRQTGRTSHNYSELGRYEARLRVTDDRGDANTDICNVTITYRNRPPVALAGDDLERFAGDLCVLNGTGSYDPDEEYGDRIASFNWSCVSHNVTLQSGSTGNPFFTPGEAGDYVFELRVADSHDLPSANVDTVNVTVTLRPNKLPVADTTRTVRSALVGELVVLDGSRSRDPDGSIDEYEWECVSHGGVHITNATSARAEFVPEEEGNHSFTLRVLDDRGDWSAVRYANISVSEPVIVNLAPEINVIPVNQTEVYVPVSFSAEGSYDPNDDTNGNGRIDGGEKDNLRYTWDVDGDGASDAYGKKVSFTYTEAGSYEVTATAVDSGGLTAEDSFIITVLPENDAPMARIDLSPGTVFNIGQDVLLTAYTSYDAQEDADGDGKLSPGESGDLVFSWDGDLLVDSDSNGDKTDDTDGTGPEYRLGYDTYGEFHIGLTVTDDRGLWDDAETRIVINSPPMEPSLEHSAGTGDYYQYQPITFTASAMDPDGDRDDLEFLWDMDSDGTEDASGRSVDHTFTDSGTFTVSLRVEDRHGAFVELKRMVSILAPLETTLPAPLIVKPMNGEKLREMRLTVEASLSDEKIEWLEARVDGRRWTRMNYDSADDLWSETFTLGRYGEVTVEVRGALRDWSGRVVYTETDEVSCTLVEQEEATPDKESGGLDTWVILAAGGTLLILVIAVTLLVRGSRDRDMERLKEELIDIERKRDRARRRKSSGKEAAVEVEAVKEPSKTVIRKKAGARGTDKVEEAKVPNGDDEEGGDGRAAKATEEETLEELFIACPACQNEFTSQVGGGWPHVIECPECGARGRVTEEMAAAMAG